MLGRAACAVVCVSVVAFSVVSCGSTTSSTDPPDLGDGGCTTAFLIDVHEPLPDPPNGEAACPVGVCNYQTGTGCEAGSACRPHFTAQSPDVSPGCEPAGTGVVGSACTLGKDCAPGYYCGEGSCRKQCCGADWSACDAGESCIRQVDVRAGGQVIDSGLALCFPVNDCNPLDKLTCNGSTTRECKIVDPTGAVACEPHGTAKLGEACDPTNTCVAGTVCVLDQCRQLCSADACGDVTCPADAGACVHYRRDPDGVGECTPGRSIAP